MGMEARRAALSFRAWLGGSPARSSSDARTSSRRSSRRPTLPLPAEPPSFSWGARPESARAGSWQRPRPASEATTGSSSRAARSHSVTMAFRSGRSFRLSARSSATWTPSGSRSRRVRPSPSSRGSSRSCRWWPGMGQVGPTRSSGSRPGSSRASCGSSAGWAKRHRSYSSSRICTGPIVRRATCSHSLPATRATNVCSSSGRSAATSCIAAIR